MSEGHRVIVFDFFGVICSEVAPFWLAEHFSALEAARVKATIVAAADRGDLSQADMFSELSKATGVPAEQISSAWSSYARIDWAVVDKAVDLKSRYRLGLLTNSPSPFVRGLLGQHGLARLFEAIVVSSECGHAKPDPEIYEAILRKLAVSPGDALLVDDNPVNIEGAQRAGMGGLVFHSIKSLDDI